MSRPAKPAVDTSAYDRLLELSLTLTQTELEELVQLLCACSMLRVTSDARPPRLRACCQTRRLDQRCRIGSRGTGRYPDCLFG